MAEIIIHSQNQLAKLTKEELINSLIAKEREVARYKDVCLDKAEVAERYGLSKPTVDRMIRRGDLPAIKVDPDKENSRVVFPLSMLIEKFENGRLLNAKEQKNTH